MYSNPILYTPTSHFALVISFHRSHNAPTADKLFGSRNFSRRPFPNSAIRGSSNFLTWSGFLRFRHGYCEIGVGLYRGTESVPRRGGNMEPVVFVIP
jgi:hypothetical protein